MAKKKQNKKNTENKQEVKSAEVTSTETKPVEAKKQEVKKADTKKVKANDKDKKSFAKDFKAELKKVTWPTPKQLVNNTAVVIVCVLVVAVIVFVLDVCFKTLNNYGIEGLKAMIKTEEVVTDTDTNTTDNSVTLIDSSTDTNTTDEENTTSDANETAANTTVEDTTNTTSSEE